MPSVGMRRTTRVFGTRVLRSGRRLWSEKHNNGEWVELLDNSRDSAGDATKRKERGRHGNDLVNDQEVIKMDVDEEVAVFKSENLVPKVEVANDHAGRRWGLVYTRKRKKEDCGVDLPSFGNAKRFGKQFYRKKLRKKAGSELTTKCDSSLSLLKASGGSYDNPKLWSLLVVADRSLCSWNLVSSILSSLLRYMWSARVGLHQLSAIISMKAIVSVFSSCGICFLKGPRLIKSGSCMIWHANTSIPMFRVDYSTAPHCFMDLNLRRLLEFDRLSCSLGRHLVDMIGRDDRMTPSTPYPARPNAYETSDLVSLALNDDSGKIVVSVVIEEPNSGQNVHIRSGHHMRNRSSLRSKRGRRPSSRGVRKAGGASPSSLKSLRHSGAQASPMTRRHGLRSSALRAGAAHRNVVKNINHVKFVSEGLKSEGEPTSCSSNVLVLGSEKCYRIVGATISLEASVEKQWNLVIKKDGMDPYILGAQRYMRPSSKNRVSNAVVWSTDNNDWKLEFPDKQEWLIFKELYKKCSLLNTPVPLDPVESSIPIPGVREVSDYVSLTRVFHRPASYISMKDDELSRALAGRTARYDMDSEDELWLNSLNGEVGEENLDHTPLSADDFELAIDALEKAFHFNPDAFSDECIPHIEFSLGRRVLEAVYGYWSNKKKQRRSALIKVFQLYQPRRTQLIPNSILRKKRSFKRQVSSVGKRQVSSVGRGKQRPLLQAMAAERVAREQYNSFVRVEEAKAVANRSEGLAILKRQSAQKLMEAADLAMYKAAMALRVAEMARNRLAPDTKVE